MQLVSHLFSKPRGIPKVQSRLRTSLQDPSGELWVGWEASQVTAEPQEAVIKDPGNLMQKSKNEWFFKGPPKGQSFCPLFAPILFKHQQQGKNLKTPKLVIEARGSLKLWTDRGGSSGPSGHWCAGSQTRFKHLPLFSEAGGADTTKG